MIRTIYIYICVCVCFGELTSVLFVCERECNVNTQFKKKILYNPNNDLEANVGITQYAWKMLSKYLYGNYVTPTEIASPKKANELLQISFSTRFYAHHFIHYICSMMNFLLLLCAPLLVWPNFVPFNSCVWVCEWLNAHVKRTWLVHIHI